MAPLSHDEFFSKLTDLFSHHRGKDSGQIYLTQKRLNYGQDITQVPTDSPQSDLNIDTPLPLLVRATNAKAKTKRQDKIKLSTVVAPDALDAFYTRYVEVCKAGMASLKPRDRTKRKAKAKKKKGGSS